MTLDSGLRRNDVKGIMPCPDIFEHRLWENMGGPEAPDFQARDTAPNSLRVAGWHAEKVFRK